MRFNESVRVSAQWTLTLFLVAGLVFPLGEAGLVWAVEQTVVVRQQVTAEISMTVASTTMALSPAIAGLTGGTGNASTSVSIITNNVEGYTVTFQATSVGDSAMTGDTAGGKFGDYAATTAETWSSNSSGQASQYGFGLTNGTLSSANGATGYGTCATVEACWAKAVTTTPKTIVSVTADTSAAGDSFYVKFRAHIPANANPAVPEDWYTATSTLTATVI